MLCTISSKVSTNTSPGSQGAVILRNILIRTRKDEFSVIIIGLDGAGKTVRPLATSTATSYSNLVVGLLDTPREDKDDIQ